MPRIRTIKPEFFTSEDIVSLSPLARLLYIALWCEADKRGRMAWKPRTFKMRWLPGDDCDAASLCAELVAAGLIVLYGTDLAYIPRFERHQHVNPRESESEFPEPDGWRDERPKKVGKTLRESVFERDGSKCVRCGSDDRIQADHILPQSCGGPHVLENLRTLCRSCNAARPVSGPALDEDLLRDGHTVKSLRVRFGIDASIPDMHAQGGREGKGRERKTRDASDVDDGFARFWEAYPRKVSKPQALTAWRKLHPDTKALETILSGIERDRRSEQWQRDGGKFIPHPATWLNGERWADLPVQLVAVSDVFAGAM